MYVCKLSYEVWEDIFAENDVNTIFNGFLNLYLRIFYSSFPIRKVYYKSCNKAWLTPVIKISCAKKESFFKSKEAGKTLC
jgi:urate oxidase